VEFSLVLRIRLFVITVGSKQLTSEHVGTDDGKSSTEAAQCISVSSISYSGCALVKQVSKVAASNFNLSTAECLRYNGDLATVGIYNVAIAAADSQVDWLFRSLLTFR
jgi:hypothetical protein